MRLSCTVFAYFPKVKEDYVTVTTPLSGTGFRLGLAIINMHTKFEVSSLSRSKDILGD